MRVAIASENGIVSQHFGHCEGFTTYDVEDGKETVKGFLQSPGHTPGVLPVFLSENGVNVIIAGGMGERAQMLFEHNGIDVIVGAAGTCDDAFDTYSKGELKSTASFCKDHDH